MPCVHVYVHTLTPVPSDIGFACSHLQDVIALLEDTLSVAFTAESPELML